LAYTYTDSEFKESFLSTFSQFGIVAAGDELPYLPKHIASVSLSLDFEVISGGIAFKHTSKMREEPGSGSISSGVFAEAQNQFDLHVRRSLGESTYLQLMVRNLTDERDIVAHRPFGARPSLPRTIILKIEHRVGG
jgi:Fe(3+) dicitrate transport protein